MAAARELSFTPSPIARGLTGGRTSTVGMIIADSMTHRFAVPIMLGAEAALGEIDLSMITCDARGDHARSLELARMLAARRVDGMLVVEDNNAATASVSRQVDVPVVYVYGESDEAGDVVHMPDDGAGIGLAVEHLVAIGRQRIVHLTGPGHTTAVGRSSSISAPIVPRTPETVRPPGLDAQRLVAAPPLDDRPIVIEDAMLPEPPGTSSRSRAEPRRAAQARHRPYESIRESISETVRSGW